MEAATFWKPFEHLTTSFDQVQQEIYTLFEKWDAKDRPLAWRGLTDASWALHSSLYRSLVDTRTEGDPPKEHHLWEYERQMLAEVRRWGLHMAETSRLSVLNQLAMLRHYGAPTRLIDVTFNPWIGLWFAVQKEWHNGKPLPDKDGRLFAFDVADRLINESDEYAKWEDDLDTPWPSPLAGRSRAAKAGKAHKVSYYKWTTATLAWRPPRFHPRIAAQDSGFIFGGVPATQTPTGSKKWPKSTKDEGCWNIAQVRRATSLALRAHKLQASAGGASKDAVYTIRIASDAKNSIRKKLQNLFGYGHSTLFPDFPGFATFGSQDSRAWTDRPTDNA